MSWPEALKSGSYAGVLREGFSERRVSEADWRGLTEVFGFTGGLCVC